MEGARLERSLVFAGFMGAGKTTCAGEAARLLGVPLRDTDEQLTAALGEPIEDLWAREGEAAFREREEQVVLEALAGPPGVVSLGGGALGSARVREALAEHVVVLVEVGLETAWSRVAGTTRPLAQDRAAFDVLYAERESGYRAAARATLPRSGIDIVRGALPSLVALASRQADGLRLLWATSASGDYPVWIGAGAIGAPWPLAPPSRRIVVSDANVAELHAGRVPLLAGLVEIAAGEEHKTLATAEAVWRALVEQGVTRADHVVAVGGGVVGDVAGFCAATYQRGIPVVQVPTTLVAQVDSAYGGKTGVDLPEGKNYVGAFHQPAAVLTDPAALRTLPAEELAAGFAEVVKTALIAGGPLWDSVRALERIDAESVAPLVFECARTKLDVVEADERDSGLRAVLNLGHTVGHGIEAATRYERYRHGEAISIGLVAALRLSGAERLEPEVTELLRRAGLPTSLDSGIDTDAVLDAVGRDKKRTAEGIGFVTIAEPGDVRFGQRIDAGSLRRVVEGLSR